MHSLVVYESMFGNTAEIACAIAAGLGTHSLVALTEVGVAPSEIDRSVDLLVVGGPTHAFGLSTRSSRLSAEDDAVGGVISRNIGLRDWLAGVSFGSMATSAAAFDTRIDKPRIPGSAAHAALRRLRRQGVYVAAPAESFYVSGMTGPLIPGETDRAQRWGESLAVAAEKAASRR